MTNNVFKYASSINRGETIPVEEDYHKYLTQRSFSYHADSVIIANEVNKYPDIDNKLHYYFLKGMLRPAKRYSKWWKPVTHEKVSTISKFYDMPMKQAYDIETFFNDEEIEEMEEIINTNKKNES